MIRLRMENITHAYGGPPVVDGVGLEVDEGELVCLLGPSGCGKTTLLRLAAGLERVQRGRVAIGGRTVAEGGGPHEPPERRNTGLMFQDYALFPHLTVEENILFGVNGRAPGRASWIREAMARMGLLPCAGTYPHTLSGGQQQRAALLRAVAPAPDVLLLDEPFSGLDVNRRVQVRDATLDLIKEAGTATLMVTHDPEEAMFMADRIVVMKAGRIVQTGTPFETYHHPADGFVASLFGPINRLSGTARDGRVATPLGTFDAAGLPDSGQAEVLIRPEGVGLCPESPPDGAPRARLVTVRLLGRSTLVRIAVDNPAGPEIHLQARITGVCAARPGDTAGLTIDRGQVFVFPRQ